MGVRFRIDVFQPSAPPGPMGGPTFAPWPLTYLWLDGGVAEFERALEGRSVFAHDLRYGQGQHVATSRVYCWEDDPDAAATVADRQADA